MINKNNIKIAIIGLGYVGLPLALSFAKKRNLIGYDINPNRIKDLTNGIDSTKEVKLKKNQKNIKFTNNIEDINDCNIFIITLPTPILKNKKPDLRPLKKCILQLSKILNKGSLVIIESTVYPGVTEDVIGNMINKTTGLLINKDFYMGYSPERVNPGDKKKTIEKIDKLVAGSTKKITNIMYDLYSEIIKTNVHKVDTIKIAESAKVIENIQRDLNIALVNELSLMFSRDNIDVYKGIEAASTKWNFHKYYPGLVGGHCIGVDPYYLTYWSEKKGYKSNMILSGRKINESMLPYTFKNIIKSMKNKKINIQDAKILLMGASFKENCTDIRNSKSIELAKLLAKKSRKLFIFDPYVKKEILDNEITNYVYLDSIENQHFNCIIIATPHKEITSLGYDYLLKHCYKKFSIIDIKNCLKDDRVDFTL